MTSDRRRTAPKGTFQKVGSPVAGPAPRSDVEVRLALEVVAGREAQTHRLRRPQRHGRGGVEVLGPQLHGGDLGMTGRVATHVVETRSMRGRTSRRSRSRSPRARARGGVERHRGGRVGSTAEGLDPDRPRRSRRADARVTRLMGMTGSCASTSRISVVPDIRIVSGSSPNVGVAIPPGAARRPNRPLATKRRRARMCGSDRVQRLACGAVGIHVRQGHGCEGAGGLSASSKSRSST